MAMQTFSFDAIGTRWVIDVDHSLSEPHFTKVKQDVRQRIEIFDATYSRFRTDSLIHTISQKTGSYLLPADGKAMLTLYKKLYDITGGLFTPLIGSVLEEAGYDKTYSLQTKKLHTPPRWEDTLSLTGDTLTVHKPALLDFGALGKGAIIDYVGSLLRQEGLETFCIDAGGDILYRNQQSKPLRVGLEHPETADQVIGVAMLINQSIAASAGNRRKWGEFHHIINPETLRPVQTILASWIIAPSATLADALATAVFFVSPEILRNHFDFSYLILYPDYTVNRSDAFPGELYYTDHA